MKLSVGCFLLFLLVLTQVCIAGPRWTSPGTDDQTIVVPKMTAPINLDGDLSEWAGIPGLSARGSECMVSGRPSGPMDAGIETFVAWTDSGVCLAAVVVDDELANPLTVPGSWPDKDSLIVFIDSRPERDRSLRAFNENECRLFIRPPVDGLDAAVAVIPTSGSTPRTPEKGREVRIAGKRTATGYTIEVLVPWGAVNGLPMKPGKTFNLQFMQFEYDASEGRTDPIYVTAPGEIWPRVYNRYALITAKQGTTKVDPGPSVTVRVAPIVSFSSSIPVSVEVSSSYSPIVKSIHVRAEDSSGKQVLDTTLGLDHLPAPWQNSVGVFFDWKTGRISDGLCTITTELLDRNGDLVGTSKSYIPVVAGTISQGIIGLRKADLSKLSQKEPFRAAAYLGVGAAVERVKSSAQKHDLSMLALQASEISARLAVLDGRAIDSSDFSLLDLLNLTADTEAQMTVEFRSSTNATVGFYVGSMLIATASIYEYSNPEEARKAVELTIRDWKTSARKAKIAGYPAAIIAYTSLYGGIADDDFDPKTQVFLWNVKTNNASIVSISDIGSIYAESVVFMPDCPSSVRTAVEAWSHKTGARIEDFAGASRRELVLIAGDTGKLKEVEDKIKSLQWIELQEPTSGNAQAITAKGRWLIEASAPSEDMAMRVVELVAAGKPVKPSDIDSLCSELVKCRPAGLKMVVIPEGMAVWAGDPHSHTFYSDGSTSPAHNIMEAIYCYLDYIAMTDHNTVRGAERARELQSKTSLDYPVIFGEEITYPLIHVNGYPLKSLIEPNLSPEDTAKAVHAQGGIIQWNHPGYPTFRDEWSKAHLKGGLMDSGIDAWEHLPAYYHKWKDEGHLPPVVGSSDTHDGTFGVHERTVILGPTPEGDSVAAAIRDDRSVVLHPSAREFLYGPDDMLAIAWNAITDGKALKDQKAEQIRTALKNADIPLLIR